MREFLIFLFISLYIIGYSKVNINGIDIDEKEIAKYQEYIRFRAVADMVFEESKVASLKYYEKVLTKLPNDFVSLSRMALIHAIKDVVNLSLYYGTNALEVYKKIDKKNIYTLNYIELMTALSLSYTKTRDEINSYFYLDEAKKSLYKLTPFKSDYEKAKKLIELAEEMYKKEFYNIYPTTNTIKTTTTNKKNH